MIWSIYKKKEIHSHSTSRNLDTIILFSRPSKYIKWALYLQKPGVEPGPPAWQARILPLNHQCLLHTKQQAHSRYIFIHKSFDTNGKVLQRNSSHIYM